jgi:hypothetical protein
MVNSAISASVRRFLRQDIASPECLYVLLLMRRHMERWWEAQQLAKELSLSAETVQTQLERLSVRNLLDVRIAESVIYRYHPGTDWLATLIDDISRAHDADHQNVHDLVSGTQRGVSLFADAFRFRKDKCDG